MSRFPGIWILVQTNSFRQSSSRFRPATVFVLRRKDAAGVLNLVNGISVFPEIQKLRNLTRALVHQFQPKIFDIDMFVGKMGPCTKYQE